ncbi:MAG: ribbon-helix-helix domain-containing protein [Nanoarchaeota archaeon]|nr:ribbon-helix-helix domain-containing protein [Nanoarchaeota archaeon]
MATEMITVKMDDAFLGEVDRCVKKGGYQNRTEFIRNALREKVDEAKLREAMMSIAHLKGASKKKTSDEQLEQIREQVFKEFEKKFNK